MTAPTRSHVSRNNNPADHGCNVRIFGLAVVFAFCMRMWIAGIFDYVEMKHLHEQWRLTDATVVGVNATWRDESFARTAYFCPMLNYETGKGQNITAISNADCYRSKRFALELVGSELQIRYDPWEPENFIEQDEYDNELTVLTLVIFCGIFLTMLFGFILIRTITTVQNNEVDTQSDEELAIDPVVARKKREELIRSSFYFQKVSSEKSNMDIGSIHSIRESTNKSNREHEELDTEEVDEEMGDDSSEIGPQNASSLPSPSSPLPLIPTAVQSLACTFALNSTLLSSWRRPAEVVECCICLEEYEQGEIICAAKTAECNHFFHEKCVTGWLLAGHDQCPLCRINLLKDEPTAVHK
mmetsp:Transcript_8630/g.20743  ORF Transcript_8630/g.20743 Transcript_8630/m.20743 type:complete len:356 (-) Transcript_8630:128-1195(-)